VTGESALFSLPAADKSAVPEKVRGDVEKLKAKSRPEPTFSLSNFSALATVDCPLALSYASASADRIGAGDSSPEECPVTPAISIFG
jgi:hypothetical protein